MTTAYEDPADSARQLVVAALPIATETEGAGPDQAAQTLSALAAETGPEVVECLAVAAAVMTDVAMRTRSVDMAATMRQLGAALQVWDQARRDRP
ncbi:MAG: hypothetical protein ACREX8_11925 [Gammaproteobacteria bacterium]